MAEGANPQEMAKRIDECSADFDTEEHIKMLIYAKDNGLSGVPSIRELVEDADAIRDMLKELAEAVMCA